MSFGHEALADMLTHRYKSMLAFAGMRGARTYAPRRHQ
jgi:hypothetical protein